MKIIYAPKFKKKLKHLPQETREKFYKQAEYLLHDLRHSSLRAKKYDETNDIWQARVNGGMRFYFTIEGDTYHLLNIKKHPK